LGRYRCHCGLAGNSTRGGGEKDSRDRVNLFCNPERSEGTL
jgi:hypothetical protein